MERPDSPGEVVRRGPGVRWQGLEELIAALANIKIFAIFMQRNAAFQGPSESPEGRQRSWS